MKRFTLNQRIRVTKMIMQSGRYQGLNGKTGRVVRCRICDDSAWVAMDEPMPSDELRSFPKGDPHGREDHIILYPPECEAIEIEKSKEPA